MNNYVYQLAFAPTSNPTSSPSELPSSKPSCQPTSIPSSSPTNPTSQPSMMPTIFPSIKPSNQPTNKPSIVPSVQPTAQPSTQPTLTNQPTESSQVNNYSSSTNNSDSLESIGLKIGFSIASFIFSAIIGYLLRKKIAYYVLQHWGHTFLYIHDITDFDKSNIFPNEIGLYVLSLNTSNITNDTNNNLYAIYQSKEYNILIDANPFGISRSSYESIRNGIMTQTIATVVIGTGHSGQYNLMTPLDKNQLLNYLINCNAIKPQKLLYFLRYYKELGFIKGFIYYYAFHYFEDNYIKSSRKTDPLKHNSSRSFSSSIDLNGNGVSMNPIISLNRQTIQSIEQTSNQSSRVSSVASNHSIV